jgi:SAM-dependent methyltransferase
VIARTPSGPFAAAALAAVLAGCASPAHTSESSRLLEALALQPGQRVADVGAGNGEWAERLARSVGESGHVWATEVEADKVEKLASRLRDAGLLNFTTLLGDQRDTGLPEGCCDAILLRLVYHHFTEPATMRAGLRRALRPGGRLVIVDTAPRSGWRELPSVPDRGGHGIPLDDLIAEVSADGFELIERHDDWAGGEAEYCAVFRLAVVDGRGSPAGSDAPQEISSGS